MGTYVVLTEYRANLTNEVFCLNLELQEAFRVVALNIHILETQRIARYSSLRTFLDTMTKLNDRVHNWISHDLTK